MKWFVGGMMLLLVTATAWAFTTIESDGSGPISIRTRSNRILQINFPSAISGHYQRVREGEVAAVIAKNHPKQLVIDVKALPTPALLNVNTIAGKQYVLKLVHGSGEIHDVVTITDAIKADGVPVTAEAGGPLAQPQPASADPIRDLWFAQWGQDPARAPRSVTMTPMQGLVHQTETARTEAVWSYKTRGYYGFTQRIVNLGTVPKSLWLPGLHDPSARLWSANLDGHQPPLGKGQPTHVLQPGQSVLLHLVYQEVQ